MGGERMTSGLRVICHDVAGRRPTLGGASQMAAFDAAVCCGDQFDA
jgi:hypothetical protein